MGTISNIEASEIWPDGIDRHLLKPTTLATFEGSEFQAEPDRVISIVQDCFGELMNDRTNGLEYRDAYGAYRQTTQDDFYELVEKFLRRAYLRAYKKMSASTYINGIQLSLPPIIENIRLPLMLWRADLKIFEGTNLGDGISFYSEATRTWKFTQNKGNYISNAVLKARQRR